MKITENEMRGLLAGKCLPSDILVGESLAAYLARKFSALQQKLDALAAENAAREEIIGRLIGQYSAAGYHAVQNSLNPAQSLLYDAMQVLKQPVTDAYLNAMRAEGVIMFATKQLSAGELDSTITLERLMLDAEEFAGQLRAGKDGE